MIEIVLLAGMFTIGTTVYKLLHQRQFSHYAVCFTFGGVEKRLWIKKKYSTEKEWEIDEKELVNICLSPSKNSFFRDMGAEGISVIDMDNGREVRWVRLVN